MKILIIIIAVFWVGLKAYKGMQKSFVNPEEAVDEPQQAETPRPAFESLFSDEEPVAVETSTFEEEEQAAGYYTYESTATFQAQESERPVWNAPEQPERQTKPAHRAAMVADEPEETSAQPFDLRKAIIYQTILHNKYTLEPSL